MSNIHGALTLAGNFKIPEVCVFFHKVLLRGNRVSLSNCESSKYFASPKYPPLAELNQTITINWDHILKAPPADAKLIVIKDFSDQVADLVLSPETNDAQFEYLMSEEHPYKALIITSFCYDKLPKVPQLLELVQYNCEHGRMNFVIEPAVVNQESKLTNLTSVSHSQKKFKYFIPCEGMVIAAAYAKVSMMMGTPVLSADNRTLLKKRLGTRWGSPCEAKSLTRRTPSKGLRAV